MTNLGPLTTTYTPTGTDCQSSFIGANNDNQWFQYGQPTSTGACFPNSFEPFEGYYYSPGVCPSGYTPACSAGVGTSTTQATCCPMFVILPKLTGTEMVHLEQCMQTADPICAAQWLSMSNICRGPLARRRPLCVRVDLSYRYIPHTGLLEVLDGNG